MKRLILLFDALLAVAPAAFANRSFLADADFSL